VFNWFRKKIGKEFSANARVKTELLSPRPEQLHLQVKVLHPKPNFAKWPQQENLPQFVSPQLRIHFLRPRVNAAAQTAHVL